MVRTKSVSPVFRSAVLAIAFVFVPLSLLGVHFLIAEEFDEVRRLRATAERTVETRDRLGQLLTLHLDVETSVRGYVLTSNPDFLGPYLAAVPRRDEAFASLRGGSDQNRLAKLDALMAASDRQLRNAATNAGDVSVGNAELARSRIAIGHGRAMMDEIRALIAEMDAEETARLVEQTNAAAASREHVQDTVNLLLLGLAVLLALVTLVVGGSIRQRRHALARVEQLAVRQRAMFDGAVDGMLWLDAEGNIMRMNPSISRMFGYSEAELLGKPNLVLMEHVFSPEASRTWLASVDVAGADGAGRKQEFVGKRCDGSTFETEVAISRVEDVGSDDSDTNYVASIRDISARKQAERMKNEFVSTVSHELRTPLTSIGGSLGLVMGGAAGPLEDKTRRLIGIAHSNCERLIRLINDILDIEKIESGKMEFDIRRMQLGLLIRQTCEAMTGFAEKHRITIKTIMTPWPLCVMGDPDRLEQLLTNLLSNAIKHSPDGAEVEIVCTQNAGLSRIEICDRGAGIPPAFRSRIFDKFAMADSSDSRAMGGTGLGLSIAREIARRHGGDIGFADREGGGTKFYLDLPLAMAQEVETEQLDADLPLVLHLDDDADCLSVVASALAGRAIVLPAQTLHDARTLAAKEQLSALIVDIGLSGESGLDFVRECRQTHPHLPIILFTAIDDAVHNEGADRVLVKSRASIVDLSDTVSALIERRERQAV